jgi:hypothetical protein
MFLTNWTVSAPPRLGEARDTCRLQSFEELMGSDCPRAAVQDGRYRGHSITEQPGPCYTLDLGVMDEWVRESPTSPPPSRPLWMAPHCNWMQAALELAAPGTGFWTLVRALSKTLSMTSQGLLPAGTGAQA